LRSAPMVSSRRRVESMISGPMPSPRMTVICCVTLPSLLVGQASYSKPLVTVRVLPRHCDQRLMKSAAGALHAQHAIERALLIERIEIIKTADVLVADDNLRHRPATAALDHLGALAGFIDHDFGEIDIFCTQQI